MPTDPLEFWAVNTVYSPIFGRIARQVFHVGPTECSREEFFSVPGRICSDLRTNLIPEHVEEQSCNYYWKREELDYEDKKGDARLKASSKFAALSIQLQLIPPTETSEENEILEDSTIEIAENIAAVTAKRAVNDAISATNDENDV